MRVVCLSWVWKVVYFCNKHFALDLFEAGEQASKETNLSYKGKGVFQSTIISFHSLNLHISFSSDKVQQMMCWSFEVTSVYTYNGKGKESNPTYASVNSWPIVSWRVGHHLSF